MPENNPLRRCRGYPTVRPWVGVRAGVGAWGRPFISWRAGAPARVVMRDSLQLQANHASLRASMLDSAPGVRSMARDAGMRLVCEAIRGDQPSAHRVRIADGVTYRRHCAAIARAFSYTCSFFRMAIHFSLDTTAGACEYGGVRRWQREEICT